MGKSRQLTRRSLLLLSLVLALALTVTSGLEDAENESERSERDVSSQKFGSKLKQRRPKKLEVELELPLPDSADPQGEELDTPSSTLPPVRTNRGRVPSKVMVRTHLTTTTPSYEEVGVGNFLHYYQNPYVSRKPSIPPKKYVLKKVHKEEHEEQRAFSFPDFPRTTPAPVEEVTTTTEAHYYEPETTERHFQRQQQQQYQAEESRDFEESRTLARTLQTPVPERPLNRGKVSNSLKTVEAPKRRITPVTTRRLVTTTTTTTTTEAPVVQEQYETTYEPQEYTQPQEVSGNSQEFENGNAAFQAEPEVETTAFVSTSTRQVPTTTTTTTSSVPTTERSFLRTTGQRSTKSSTQRRQTQTPTQQAKVKTRTSVAVVPVQKLATTPVPPRDLSLPKTGIPLKVKTITFKPIYRSLHGENDKEQDDEVEDSKPELELLRAERAKEAATARPRTTSATEGEDEAASTPEGKEVDPMDAARFWEASVTQESTLAPETEATTKEATTTTELDPVAAAKYWVNSQNKEDGEEGEGSEEEQEQTSTTAAARTTTTPAPKEVKPKVHYLVTVIGAGENGTDGSPHIPNQQLQQFLESGDGNGFPFTLGEQQEEQEEQGQGQTQEVEEPQPRVVKLSAEVSGQEEKGQEPRYQVVELPQPKEEEQEEAEGETEKAPAKAQKSPSAPEASGRETIFHYSSSDALPEPQVQHRTKYGNFIVEDHSPNNFRQGGRGGGRAFDWRPIPLRTVVNFEPEPTLPKEAAGSALFTGKSVAYFSHVAEDGRITKQLRSSQGPKTLDDLISNIQQSRTGGFDPYLEQQRQREREFRFRQQQEVFGGGSFFRAQRDLVGGGLRAVPAQSFYLGDGRGRREEEEREEVGGVRALRDVPFTVDYVSQ